MWDVLSWEVAKSTIPAAAAAVTAAQSVHSLTSIQASLHFMTWVGNEEVAKKVTRRQTSV